MDENYLASILGGQAQPGVDQFGVPAAVANYGQAPQQPMEQPGTTDQFGVPAAVANYGLQPPPGTAPAVGDASNVLQALNPVPVAPQPDPPAASAPQTPAALPQQEPRPRHSLLDFFGRIADTLATAGGQHAQYQPGLDAATARTNLAQDRVTQAGDHARAVDLDKLKLAVMQNQLSTAATEAGNTAKGKAIQAVQAIQQAHKDDHDGGAAAVAKAWPILAQQAGLNADDVSHIGGIIQGDPNMLAALDRQYNGIEEFDTKPLLYQKADGTYGYLQSGKHGDTNDVELPEGAKGFVPDNAVTYKDQGGATIGYDKMGRVVSRVRNTESPDKAADIAGRTDVENAKLNAPPKGGKGGTDDPYGSYVGARSGVVGMINGIKDLISDPNLNSATGYISGAVDTPARQRIEGKIKAIEGQAVPVSVALLKASGVRNPAQKEVIATSQGLLGDLKLLRQSTGDFKDRGNAAVARLQQRVSQLDDSAKRTGLVKAPGAPPARPVLPASPVAKARAGNGHWGTAQVIQ